MPCCFKAKGMHKNTYQRAENVKECYGKWYRPELCTQGEAKLFSDTSYIIRYETYIRIKILSEQRLLIIYGIRLECNLENLMHFVTYLNYHKFIP